MDGSDPLPAGRTLWRVFADGHQEHLATHVHVALGWVSARPDFVLPSVPVGSPELVGIWAEVKGERVLADVTPDGGIILCAPRQQSACSSPREGCGGDRRRPPRWNASSPYGWWAPGRASPCRWWPRRGSRCIRTNLRSAHLVYIGHDVFAAEALGIAKTDAGVYETVVNVRDIVGLHEQQTDLVVRAGLEGPSR